MIRIFAAIALIAAFISGCSNSACLENKSALPLAGFYSMETRHAIKVDSIMIGGIGAPRDSLLLDNESAGEVFLPFRTGHTATSFFIRYTSKALDHPRFNDTIKFDYEPRPYFASDECGAMYIYRVSGLSYTRHLIDSIGIVDSLITNVNRQYIHIFFRTGEGADR